MITLLLALSRVPRSPRDGARAKEAHPGSACDGPAACSQAAEVQKSASEGHDRSKDVPQHHQEAVERDEETPGNHDLEEEAAFFWHLCASGFLCPEFHARAAALIADLSAAETCPLPQVLPFVHMQAYQWPVVRQVMHTWADAPLPAAQARACCREQLRRSVLCVPPPHALAVRHPLSH